MCPAKESLEPETDAARPSPEKHHNPETQAARVALKLNIYFFKFFLIAALNQT